MQVKHAFTSAKADGPDSTRLRPSNWNADHDVTVAGGPVVLGRSLAGPGPVVEIPFSQLLPGGLILPYGGAAAPAQWELVYGQTVNRITYAFSFAAFGTTYGAGDGVTTFRFPDLRGVVPAGKSDMGGSDRGNLSGGTVLGNQIGAQSNGGVGVSVGVSGGISGSTFGSLSVAVSGNTGSASNLGGFNNGGSTAAVDHSHTVNIGGGTSGALGVTGSFSGSGSGATGGFSLVQPTIVLNYITNTGV